MKTQSHEYFEFTLPTGLLWHGRKVQRILMAVWQPEILENKCLIIFSTIHEKINVAVNIKGRLIR